MNEIIINKQPILISDHYDNPDNYALIEFGKIVNRCSLVKHIISSDFWTYLKNNYNIENKNIILNSIIYSDSKFYKYIVKIEKPYKLILSFNEIQEQQINEIRNLSIYYDYDAVSEIDKIVDMFKI